MTLLIRLKTAIVCLLTMLVCIAFSPAAQAQCPSICDSSFNTALGTNALVHNIGTDNTAVGVQALFSNTTGGNNTAGLGKSSKLATTRCSPPSAVSLFAERSKAHP
jgi:hypothetical protein